MKAIILTCISRFGSNLVQDSCRAPIPYSLLGIPLCKTELLNNNNNVRYNRKIHGDNNILPKIRSINLNYPWISCIVDILSFQKPWDYCLSD